MSEHVAKVWKIDGVLPHDNADSLELVAICGYITVVQKGRWNVDDLAIFIEPDTLVPAWEEQFKFLANDAGADGYARVRAKKLRGVISPGLVIPPPEGAKEGDNFFEHLNLRHYDPPEPFSSQLNTRGFACRGPGPLSNLVYDVENFRKYHSSVFYPGEYVFVTEKLHGCFPEGTLISLANGRTKPIEDIQPGDDIISYDESTKNFTISTVEDTHNNGSTSEWIRFVLEDNRELVVTPDHLMFTTNRGWVKAKYLEEKDDIACYPTENMVVRNNERFSVG